MLRRPLIAAVCAAAVTAGIGPGLATISAASAESGGDTSVVLDTQHRRVVERAYLSDFAANFDVDPGWTGSTVSCNPGAISTAAMAATLESINFARSLAGLASVTTSDDLNSKAQGAALMAAAEAQGESVFGLSCWNLAGYQGLKISNVAVGEHLTPAKAVAAYLFDSGPTNTGVGHRRWMLNPQASSFGIGFTDSSNAIAVVGPTDSTKPNPRWVAWPSAGWFPEPLEPRGRWSLASGSSDADFSHATVRVTELRAKGNRTLRTTVEPVVDDVAMPTLVWQVRGVRAGGRYRVQVRGVQKASASKFSYVVRLFQPGSQ